MLLVLAECGVMAFRTSSRLPRGGFLRSQEVREHYLAFAWQPGKSCACAVTPSRHFYVTSAMVPEVGKAQV